MKITGTVQEAVQASGLSKSLIYNKIRDGELKATTVGRRRLVLWESLRSMLEAA